jgi:hypothetical protein
MTYLEFLNEGVALCLQARRGYNAGVEPADLAAEEVGSIVSKDCSGERCQSTAIRERFKSTYLAETQGEQR